MLNQQPAHCLLQQKKGGLFLLIPSTRFFQLLYKSVVPKKFPTGKLFLLSDGERTESKILFYGSELKLTCSRAESFCNWRQKSDRWIFANYKLKISGKIFCSITDEWLTLQDLHTISSRPPSQEPPQPSYSNMETIDNADNWKPHILVYNTQALVKESWINPEIWIALDDFFGDPYVLSHQLTICLPFSQAKVHSG